MKTLYIDVYFFINFCVDILALIFASKFAHIRAKFKNLMLTSTLASLCSIIDIFFGEHTFLHILNILIVSVLISILIGRNISYRIRIRFSMLFFLFEATLGGLIYVFYSFLDRLFEPILGELKGGSENKKALIISCVILFSVGVSRLMIMLFSNSENENTVLLKITVDGKSVETEALVDSGNLAKDPMSMCPCVFIKEDFAKKFLPKEILHICDIDKINFKLKKRIRLIPVTKFGITHILTGVRCDSISVIKHGKPHDFDGTLVIDRERGSFGGYLALMPKLNF